MTQLLVGFVIGAVATLALVLWVVVNRSWRHATFSGAPIPWLAIAGMRLRGTPTALIVDAYVTLVKRGRSVTWDQVEAAYLAQGDRRVNIQHLVGVVERSLGDGAV